MNRNNINLMQRVKTFTVTSQPFYDEYTTCYKNILMVNMEPLGPLRKFVRRIRMPRLSTLHSGGYNPYNNGNSFGNGIYQCGTGFAIVNFLYGYNYGYNFNKGNHLMTPDQIPNLISWLLENGYQIDTQITNMLNNSELRSNNTRLAFTATYFGKNQPNIVYMR
jgi:hypothetical protein